MATAGAGAESDLLPGTRTDVAGSILERVVEGKTVSRQELEERRYPEEEALLRLGLRARVVGPLQLGTRTIGALSVARATPTSFAPEEIELVTLLGRFVAAAVQNIRTYEAERATVEELRRLSALRADFVSLVSHELRSPMAAVIGSARTLQTRWRELRPDQREAFLAVIADETSRLSALVEDVLDTSRIEAGTFGYTFDRRGSRGDAPRGDGGCGARPGRGAARGGDPACRCRRSVATASGCGSSWTTCSGTRSSTPGAGTLSRWLRRARNGAVEVRVRDSGPGIAAEDHGLIFEKFGRAGSKDARSGYRPRPLHLTLVRRGARRHPSGRLAARRGRGLHADAPDRAALGGFGEIPAVPVSARWARCGGVLGRVHTYRYERSLRPCHSAPIAPIRTSSIPPNPPSASRGRGSP